METLFIGKNPIFLPEINSTNSYATLLLKNVNPPEGTIVYTAHQTEGRGQRGTVWKAEPLSNVTASVILKPTFLELKNQFFLYKIIALACFDTLADLLDPGQFDIKIKWPNDILVNKKKIAGVLIENNISSSSIASTVAGIGINVNQFDFDGLENATSLKIVTGRDFSVPAILGTLCHRIEHYYLALRQNKLSEISSAYLSKMYGLGMALEFTIGTRRRSLFVKGVTEGGLLKLEDENGHLVEADVKELTWML